MQHLPFVFHCYGGSGPNVLFLHATGFNGMMYLPLAEPLLSSYTCYGVDFPGHGDNAPAPGLQLEVVQLAESLVAALQQQGLDRSHVFGHSGGAAVALLAEARHPGTFASLYVYEPVASTPSAWVQYQRGMDPTADNILATLALKRRSTFSSPQEAAASLGRKPPFQGMQRRVVELYVQHGLVPDVQQGEVPDVQQGEAPQQGCALHAAPGRSCSCQPPAATSSSTHSSSSSSSSSSRWRLACPPDVEAQYYRLFAPPVPIPPGAITCPLAVAAHAEGSRHGAGSMGSSGPGGGSAPSSSSSSAAAAAGSRRTELHSGLPALAAALALSQPGARYVPCPGLTHFGPFEDPAAVGVALRVFLAETAAAGVAVHGSRSSSASNHTSRL
jgi:pimeloyl-ACP methyl ester carboxylesterase